MEPSLVLHTSSSVGPSRKGPSRNQTLCTQAAPLQGSGFGYCASAAGNVTGAVDAALPPSAGGVASLATFRAASRYTVGSENCRLPVVYG